MIIIIIITIMKPFENKCFWYSKIFLPFAAYDHFWGSEVRSESL